MSELGPLKTLTARAVAAAICLALGSTGSVTARTKDQDAAAAGRQLVTMAGCAGCHAIADPAFAGLPVRGPDLRRIAAKTDPGWAVRFITAPRDFRPTTWMPHFFEDADPEEIRAVVSYLWDRSLAVDYPAPPAGDAARGQVLFESVGCTGCHLREVGAARDDFHGEPYRLQGPNLIRLGSKVGAGWLYAWLKDPRQYAPETVMPNLRLSDEQAADLTAFLTASRDPAWEGLDSSPADVDDGREAIEFYGCYGCHRIAGFEDAGQHAGEVTSAAGFSGHGLSGLPNFGLSAGEVAAIQAATSAAGDAALVAGRRLVAVYNCRGCHLVEGRGQAIRATIADPGLLPPNLKSEGSRVQSDWLAAYLDHPAAVRLRPWLTAQMPTFGFSAEELEAAVAYFAALEERELAELPAAPLAARSIALGRETFHLLQCGRCHPAGAEAAAALGLPASDLAPALEIANQRLRYEWIALWLKDPQLWQPGTRMPTFFFQSRPGVFDSPFAGGLDAPVFAEPKARMMEHFASVEELSRFLNDADAVTAAMRDYVWSLTE